MVEDVTGAARLHNSDASPANCPAYLLASGSMAEDGSMLGPGEAGAYSVEGSDTPHMIEAVLVDDGLDFRCQTCGNSVVRDIGWSKVAWLRRRSEARGPSDHYPRPRSVA